jgi:hypothetical protein
VGLSTTYIGIKFMLFHLLESLGRMGFYSFNGIDDLTNIIYNNRIGDIKATAANVTNQ